MNGRLEALITIPGSTSLTIDDGGGADVALLNDGPYYWTELLAEIETQIEAAVGSGFTVSASFGENGTGRITIAKTSGTFKVLFSSDGLANLFGVAAAGTWNVTPASSFTSSNGVLGVWLPGCPVSSEDEGAPLDFDLPGHLMTDERQTIGPTGVVSTFISTNAFHTFKKVRWSHVDRERALYGASTTIRSWQEFRRQCLRGGNAYFPIDDAGLAPTVLYYYNADANTLCGSATGYDGEYQLVLSAGEQVRRAAPGWNGLWAVELDEMVKTT